MIYAGQKVTASALNDLGLLSARRVGDSAKSTSTTLAPDTQLNVQGLKANAVYMLSGLIYYSGSATGDFNFSLTADAGAAATFATLGVSVGGPYSLGTSVSLTVASLNVLYVCTLTGTLSMGATLDGTGLQFNYAENASDTSNGSWVGDASFLSLQRMA